MATTSWNQWYARCPYYVSDDGKKKIKCTGICDGTSTSLEFSTKELFQCQMNTFCRDKYQKCELFTLLDGIYSEEE